jgi:sugar phosphate isomerase/epimerase
VPALDLDVADSDALGGSLMPRPITLFTGQWADQPLEHWAPKVAEWGYDGIELPCWGGHFDVKKALEDDSYCKDRKELLARYGLNCWAISAHLVGQAVLDPIDGRHQAILPPYVWGDGDPKGVNRRAAEELKDTARAAAKLGVTVVNGFTGSSIWHMLYAFPPTPTAMIEAGFQQFADVFNPILDVFKHEGVRFGLEVHPTEIAFDTYSAVKAIDAVDGRPEFGFNYDPSHLLWQGMDPARYLREPKIRERIYHVHVKDVATTLDGRTGLLSSHLDFGDPRRGWDFRSPGRGQVDFAEITRELNLIGYEGPLSVEWEDPGMDREYGAAEAVQFIKRTMMFPAAGRAFDSAFAEGQSRANA